MALKMHPSLAMPVGDWMKSELIEPRGLSVKALAAHLGVSRQALSNLLNGHSGLSADMALRLEKAFGVSAETLLRMQMAYDVALVRRRETAAAVEPLAA